MNKLIKFFYVALLLSLILALGVFASDYSNRKTMLIDLGVSSELIGDDDTAQNLSYATAYSSNFPEINESGNIVGLDSYYCPLNSENKVEAFSSGDDLNAFETNKFSINAVQGGGLYSIDVFRQSSIDLDDLSLSFDPYFAAVSFFGDPISINISVNTDIESGYSVFSNKGKPAASFDSGVLSISVNQAQILKVVFDGAIGKTLYIFVGYKNALDAFDIENMLKNGINTVVNTGCNGEATYTCPVKTVVDNKIVYYPAVYSKENAYLISEIYSGEYEGNDTLSFKGDIYIPVDSFAGNGNFDDANYDRMSGTIYLSSEKINTSTLNGFKSAKGSVVSENNNSITFYDNSDVASKGIFAEIDNTSLLNADCLKFSSTTSMSGKSSGVKISLAVLGYDDLGKTDVIANANIRTYNKANEVASYFDISTLSGAYESFYFVIIIEDVPGITVTMCDTRFAIFDVSFGLGDNEFNPF